MINVKSGRTIAARLAFWSHDDPKTGCRVWHGARGKYGQLGIVEVKGKKARMRYAHRLMWIEHNGPIPKGKHVLHNCPAGDNPLCVRLEHLWLGTPQQNVADMIAKGRARYLRGEKAAGAKLTERQARAIKRDQRPHKYCARKFNISEKQVSSIKLGRKWAHL